MTETIDDLDTASDDELNTVHRDKGRSYFLRAYACFLLAERCFAQVGNAEKQAEARQNPISVYHKIPAKEKWR